MKKRRFGTVFIALVLCLSFSSCNGGKEGGVKEWGIEYEAVPLDFSGVQTVLLDCPQELNSMQDLSDFMDYCVFYGSQEEIQYATLTDEYAAVVREDPFYQYRWAGQYGNLSHNFAIGYADGRLDENMFGIMAGFVPYAFKSYDLKEDNVKVVNYEYYQEVLKEKKNRNYAAEDFALYRNNNGFVSVENSEQLFYAAAKGYMPVPVRGSSAESMLSRALGILNRILEEDMNETEKVRRIYSYLICENTYDYESFLYKDSEHTDYTAYFLEGVFDSKNAVCDGLAKAMTLLCRLEGIEAYHIGAVSSAGGHAYNYIKVDGSYYLCCPTNGSSVSSWEGKRFHYHTYSYFLTDFYTSSPSWDFASGQLPEIGEQVKQTEKYDYWDNAFVEVDGKKYNLSPETTEEAVAVLETVGENAEESGLIMQIELNCSYDIAAEAFEEIEEKYDVMKLNNGSFGGEKLYAFVFGGGAA